MAALDAESAMSTAQTSAMGNHGKFSETSLDGFDFDFDALKGGFDFDTQRDGFDLDMPLAGLYSPSWQTGWMTGSSLKDGEGDGQNEPQLGIFDISPTSNSNLQPHLTSRQSQRWRLLCKVCRTGFSTHSSLKRHFLSRHSAEKYPCSECDKICSRRDQLH